MPGLSSRIAKAWNAFSLPEKTDNAAVPYEYDYTNYGVNSAYRPDRSAYRVSNERSIIASIYERIGVDTASNDIRHIVTDDQARYIRDADSGLNNCLTLEANTDQAARNFRLDMVLTLLEQGHIAIVPVDTFVDPNVSAGYDIRSLRIGKVLNWYPQHVRVDLYNERTGKHQEIVLNKSFVALVENPFYMVMNETNSTLQRLTRKLSMLDAVDEQSSSGKLDLIIQLPYVVKSEARKLQAEQRRSDIEFQLKSSKYGIAYTDGTEKITQLNRPAENNLMKQVEYLTSLLNSQLGITDAILNGTADETTMLNYQSRIVEPILSAITEEFSRKFLTKTGRSQGQIVRYFTNPFKLTPLAMITEMADKFTRNEILSSNEIRSIIGFKPSADPKADALQNSNMPQAADSVPSPTPAIDPNKEKA